MKNQPQFPKAFSKRAYDLWWQSFSGRSQRTGQLRQFYIACYVLNPSFGEDVPIFDEKNPSYVMLKVGCLGTNAKQLHRFFGTKELEASTDELRLVVGDFFLSETVSKGSVVVKKPSDFLSGDVGAMSWQLFLQREAPFDESTYLEKNGIGKLSNAPIHSRNLEQTFFRGSVFFDGERYFVDSNESMGYLSRNASSFFPSPARSFPSLPLLKLRREEEEVCFASYNNESEYTKKSIEQTSFDFLCGQKTNLLSANQIPVGFLRYENGKLLFDSCSDRSRITEFPQCKWRIKETETHLFLQARLSNIDVAIEIKASSLKAEMGKLFFPEPDGSISILFAGMNGEASISLYRRRQDDLSLVDKLHTNHFVLFWKKQEC